MALALRRSRDKSTLLYAGGVWDRLERRFTDDTPETVCVIDLEESQVEYTLWFAQFLADFRDGYPRDVSAALIAGDRRAGKTFDAYFCQWAALLEVPVIPNTGKPAIGWTVSKTYRERDELDQLVAAFIPRDWYKPMRAPEHRYDLAHGAVLRNLSADDPDGMKQGVVDWLLYNEGQKMPARAIVNGLYGTADRAGLCMIACNKPSAKDSRGEWLFDLREAIEDEETARKRGLRPEPLGIRFFGFSSKDNTKIDQPARKRVGKIAAIIDPGQAQADDTEGALKWQRPGDKAFWSFDKHQHLHAVPEMAPGLVDITREIVRERAEWGEYGYVAGVDFDWKPHIVAVVYRVFGTIEDPLFYAVDEYAGEEKWTVAQWIEAFADWGASKGYNPQSTILIGDASSGRRSQTDDPKTRGDDRTAFEIIQAAEVDGAYWTIIPPQDHRGKTGNARNPNVDQRLDLANNLLRDDPDRPLIAGARTRLRIDPKRCPWLAECAREATTERKTGRRKLVHNKYAHAIDAATYPLWRLAPRPDGFRSSPSQARFAKVRRPKTW